ncbi:MAG: LPXTG cell wall anchor domain-containing protein [Clostridia bacterium]|nr:LPXTG cell wall anchor domain-containing protein [Clostridia bacterium]
MKKWYNNILIKILPQTGGITISDYYIAGAALLVGVLLAFVNYGIARALMKKSENGLGVASLLRQLVSLSYLLALFFVGRKCGWHPWMPLVGGALGLTLPMFALTPSLLRAAHNQNAKGDEHNV